MRDARCARRVTEGRWRRLLAGAALVGPLIAIPFAGCSMADRLGAHGGGALAVAAARLDRPGAGAPPPAAAQAPEPERQTTPEARTLPVVQVPCPASDRAEARPCAGRGGARLAAQPAAPRGLRIGAAIVARAVRSGVRPSGTPVPPTGVRPGGLALHGVGALGAGLRDGDVLTSVAGAPASSVDGVVSAVLWALRKRASVLTATVWRGDAPIQVAVELPQPRG